MHLAVKALGVSMLCVAPTPEWSAYLQVPAKGRDAVVLKHCRINSTGSWCCIQGERRVQEIGCELHIWVKAGSNTHTSWAYGSGFRARCVNGIIGASFLQGHLRLNLLQSFRYSGPTKLNKWKFVKSCSYPALSRSFPFSLKKPWASAEGGEEVCPLSCWCRVAASQGRIVCHCCMWNSSEIEILQSQVSVPFFV